MLHIPQTKQPTDLYTVNGEIVKEMFPNHKMETEHVRK